MITGSAPNFAGPLEIVVLERRSRVPVLEDEVVFKSSTLTPVRDALVTPTRSLLIIELAIVLRLDALLRISASAGMLLGFSGLLGAAVASGGERVDGRTIGWGTLNMASEPLCAAAADEADLRCLEGRTTLSGRTLGRSSQDVTILGISAFADAVGAV